MPIDGMAEYNWRPRKEAYAKDLYGKDPGLLIPKKKQEEEDAKYELFVKMMCGHITRDRIVGAPICKVCPEGSPLAVVRDCTSYYEEWAQQQVNGGKKRDVGGVQARIDAINVYDRAMRELQGIRII